MQLRHIVILFIPIIWGCTQQESFNPTNYDENQSSIETVIDTQDFWHSIPALNSTGLVNVVIEIPAGDNAKWEVNKTTGFLEWEPRGDSLRVVDYLPYPANYGMVPQTYLPVDLGGDGDPLDVFVLGPRLKRGSIIPVRLVGVIEMFDNGERDDKLIAVHPESWFYAINSLADLENNYKGITDILTLWLKNYKGSQADVEILDVKDESYANQVLENSISAYQNEFIN